ncbi:hypothetical protein E4S40_15690 [Algoriphagus kandeliae]|uniref:6-bladed beta-propeller n=1 Tax=Algoriphagus kandeliae TaxID=2562278 RepID=A0A4Y9QLV1_9BACT|nr:BF3164 family lipoprotein [Algoriphagus kandeliae]TFV93684.1 hypothetical protein E4S40_15690 [Algoriphagus kandeliae]
MKKFIIILLVVFGCTKSSKERNIFVTSEITYKYGTPLLKNQLINYAYLVESFEDYLILLNFRNEHVIQIIDKSTGETVYKGINFGDGPEEIQIPISLYLDHTTSNLYIQDGGSNSVKYFNLVDFKRSNFKELKLITETLPSNGQRIFPIFPFKSSFIGISLDKDMELINFKNSNVIDTLFYYSEKVEFPNLPSKFFGIQLEGKFGISTNKKYLLKGNLYEQRISLYNLETLNRKEFFNYLEPKYKDEFIESTGRFRWDKERNFQYISIKEKDGKFYLLYSGTNIKDEEIVLLGNEIHVFDTKTQSLEKLILDNYISDFTIDENNMIYGINFTLSNPVLLFK